jgi:hypothetical protein
MIIQFHTPIGVFIRKVSGIPPVGTTLHVYNEDESRWLEFKVTEIQIHTGFLDQEASTLAVCEEVKNDSTGS